MATYDRRHDATKQSAGIGSAPRQHQMDADLDAPPAPIPTRAAKPATGLGLAGRLRESQASAFPPVRRDASLDRAKSSPITRDNAWYAQAVDQQKRTEDLGRTADDAWRGPVNSAGGRKAAQDYGKEAGEPQLDARSGPMVAQILAQDARADTQASSERKAAADRFMAGDPDVSLRELSDRNPALVRDANAASRRAWERRMAELAKGHGTTFRG